MYTQTTHLDGNAVAGAMAEVLAFDITTAVGRCAGCHETGAMALSRVYSAGPGLVLRCVSCDHVLVRLVNTVERTWLDMSGLTSMQIDRTLSD